MLSAQSAELSRRLGRAPTATELAVALGVDHSDVVDVLVTSSARHGRHVDSGAGPKEAPAMAHNLSQWDAKLECIADGATLHPVLAELPEEEHSVVMTRIFGSLSLTSGRHSATDSTRMWARCGYGAESVPRTKAQRTSLSGDLNWTDWLPRMDSNHNFGC